MTREHRLVLSLDEITAVRWECPHCHVAISYALNQTIRISSVCPSCNADVADPSGPAYRATVEFVRALKALLQAAGRPDAASPLRLELLPRSPRDRPTPKDSSDA